MVNKLLVEVSKHEALFAAWVTDVNVDIFNPKNGLYFDVTYDSYIGQKETKVHSSRVKLPCSCVAKLLAKEQEVEVYLNRVDTNPSYGYGWWPATVIDIQCDYPTKYFVQLKNPEAFISVPWNFIRGANRNSALETLDKVTLSIPSKYGYLAERADVLEQFQNLANIPFCEYERDKRELKIIYYISEINKKTLKDDFTKLFLDLCNRLDPGDDDPATESYCEEFTVPNHLLEFALGQNDSNIQLVKAIEGISRVKVDDNNIFICGKTEQIVKNARRLLDYNEEKIQVPQKFAKILDLDDGEIMQSIVEKSGLFRINIENDEEELAFENVAFHLIGTKESIIEVKFLIELQLNFWKKIMAADHGKVTPVDSKDIQSKDTRPTVPLCKTVYVDKLVYAPVMWRKTANVQAARTIQGIQKILEEDDDCCFIFKIFGDNESSLNKAEEVLYMVKDLSYHIPQHLVGKVIGEDGQKLKNIMDSSGVALVDILDSAPCPVEGEVIIQFIGHPDKIEKAKYLMKDFVGK